MSITPSKDPYSELKRQQFVPFHVPESAYASAAKSAEPSNLGPVTTANDASNNEEFEFRLNMPVASEEELKESQNTGKNVYFNVGLRVDSLISNHRRFVTDV
jgi:hypothetical protein